MTSATSDHAEVGNRQRPATRAVHAGTGATRRVRSTPYGWRGPSCTARGFAGQQGPEGSTPCSGLLVSWYSAAQLARVIRTRFRPEATRRKLHTTPADAAQPFTRVAARGLAVPAT
jgi:hypothetical protein